MTQNITQRYYNKIKGVYVLTGHPNNGKAKSLIDMCLRTRKNYNGKNKCIFINCSIIPEHLNNELDLVNKFGNSSDTVLVTSLYYKKHGINELITIIESYPNYSEIFIDTPEHILKDTKEFNQLIDCLTKNFKDNAFITCTEQYESAHNEKIDDEFKNELDELIRIGMKSKEEKDKVPEKREQSACEFYGLDEETVTNTFKMDGCECQHQVTDFEEDKPKYVKETVNDIVDKLSMNYFFDMIDNNDWDKKIYCVDINTDKSCVLTGSRIKKILVYKYNKKVVYDIIHNHGVITVQRNTCFKTYKEFRKYIDKNWGEDEK